MKPTPDNILEAAVAYQKIHGRAPRMVLVRNMLGLASADQMRTALKILERDGKANVKKISPMASVIEPTKKARFITPSAEMLDKARNVRTESHEEMVAKRTESGKKGAKGNAEPILAEAAARVAHNAPEAVAVNWLGMVHYSGDTIRAAKLG